MLFRLAMLLALTATLAQAKPRGDVLYVLDGRPITCETVRWAASVFSREYLEAEGRRRGVTPTQRRLAEACIKGK